MPVKVSLFALALVLALGCSQEASGPEDATAFTLTGTVTRVEPTTLIVATEGPVSGCTMPSGGYAVYFEAHTEFDPDDTTEDKDFPDSLEGSIVDARGSHTGGKDGNCVLVADAITVEGVPVTPEG